MSGQFWHRVIVAVTALLGGTILADQSVTFVAGSINGGGFVDDQEGFGEGDPDRYFRMAVFDSDEPNLLNAYANGGTDDGIAATPDGKTLDNTAINTGLGLWDFADRQITKIIPDGPVFFYFGLFDEDTDADDSLGDHWFGSSSNTTLTMVFNNNASAYYPGNPIQTVGGNDVEGTGDANNFRVSLQVTFQAVPEPGTSGFMVAGTLFGALKRRRQAG